MRRREERFARFRRWLTGFTIAAVLGVGVGAIAPAPAAVALSGSEFNPGLIIADSQFYDGNAMSEAQIQLFLASKGSALAGYTFSVSSRPAVYSERTGNLVCQAFTGGALSPAAIIFRAQQACGISAKVILVTLQKEQGLITKSAPTQGALDRAMGYACPDTAPCAPTTLGFGNQVYAGTVQLNTYKQGRFARQPGVQTIQFHPNAGCGSTALNVQNFATAALYNYTPYQPNAAALANLGGTGDSCSSYGNRNFWVFYNNWFGSTYGPGPYPAVGPSISGTTAVGTTLTVVAGNWAGGPTFAYSWISCSARPDAVVDTVPTGCVVIPGATTTSYVSTLTDAGRYIGVMVTGTNSLGAMTTGTTMPKRIGTPVNTVTPTASGGFMPGSTWTVDTGTWVGVPTPDLTIFWLRCTVPMTTVYTSVPSSCLVIPGANSTTYVATFADVGKYLTAQIGGINSLGFSLAGTLSPTAIGFPVNSVAPTVSGLPDAGSTWTVNTGMWTGVPAPDITIYWLRCDHPVASAYTVVPAGCAVISGARSTTYRSTLTDAGRYLTAQVGGINSMGFSLAGTINTTAVQAALPANTVPPAVSGAAAVGSTWTVDVGTWTGAPPPDFTIYWLRCNQPITVGYTAVPSGCTVIEGARAASYVSTPTDAGRYLTAQIGGVNGAGFSLAGALNSTAVVGPASHLPANTVAPTVSGAAAVGSTWTVNTGTWTGSPTPTITIYWLRCDQPQTTVYSVVPAGCFVIPGARSATYVSTSNDGGRYLTAQVGGINSLGFSLAGAVNTLATTGSSPFPANTFPPTVSGLAALGSTWSVDIGMWTGSPTPAITIYWLRCVQPITTVYAVVPAGCTVIDGARSATYVSKTADAGRYLTAQVGGINSLGFSLAGALNSTAVMGAQLPANTVPPTVTGAALAGSTWSVRTGTWTGSPTPEITIYWLRCNQPVTMEYTVVPSGCAVIPGARASTYQSTSADIGKYLTAQVGGINSVGFSIAGALNPTAVVGAAPVSTAPPTVSGNP